MRVGDSPHPTKTRSNWRRAKCHSAFIYLMTSDTYTELPLAADLDR
jgi:hypothetical protein